MLSNRSENNITFVSVINGRFTVRVNKDTEGAVKRVTKSNKEVWEKYYSRIEGVIEKVVKKTTEWEGKKIISWDIHITDESSDFVSNYIVSLSYSSREGKGFLSRLKNVNLEQPVTLSVGTFKDKNNPLKEITFLAIFQGGVKIEPFYTRENLPPMKKVRVKGNDVWDDTEQMEVFEQMIKEMFPPAVKEEPEDEPANPETASDLPF